MFSNILKKIRHKLQVLAYYFAVGAMKVVPKAKRPTVIGSMLAFLGPKTGVNKRIIRNLNHVMSNLSDIEKHQISKGVWRNLGIVYAEMTMGAELADPATGIITPENHKVYEKVRAEGRGCIMIGAHFGNWELSVLYAGHVMDDFIGFYRTQNNAYLNDKINAQRTSTGATLVAKHDRQGLRKAVKNLKNGGCVGILLDQKLNTGDDIPFLGQPAKTMPLAFSLAQATGAAVLPYRLKRQPDGSYLSIIEEEIVLPNTGDRAADKKEFLTEINSTIGRWVQEDPEQWFWFHNRWSSRGKAFTIS